MRWSGVIDVIAITRRHVGGILSVNEQWFAMRKSADSQQRLFADRPLNSTRNSLQAHESLRRYTVPTEYTAKMAAFTNH